MSTENNFDDFFNHVLCTEGNIVGFFEKIFEFLYRRTDYFKIKTDDTSGLGLETGEAENIIKSVFCKYMAQAIKEFRNDETQAEDPVILDYASEETVVTSSDNDFEENALLPIEEDSDKKNEESSTEFTSDIKMPLMDPDCYNGAYHDGYMWSQTLRDTDIRITVPTTITTGKQVHVNLEQTHVKVEVLVEDEWNVLKDKDLSFKINVEESTWTLVPGEYVHICIQKVQERWWDAFFVGEPKIDLKTIDSSIPYSDLDQESQTKIEELMYNEHLKRLGKPNLQQNNIANILKDAWNSEGSPFKGQPYDPKLLNT